LISPLRKKEGPGGGLIPVSKPAIDFGNNKYIAFAELREALLRLSARGSNTADLLLKTQVLMQLCARALPSV